MGTNRFNSATEGISTLKCASVQRLDNFSKQFECAVTSLSRILKALEKLLLLLLLFFLLLKGAGRVAEGAEPSNPKNSGEGLIENPRAAPESRPANGGAKYITI
jgi:hypothetical protein